MMRPALLLATVAFFAACAPAPTRSAEGSADAPAEPARRPATESYGEAIEPTTPEVSLAQLAQDPAAHAGRRVRTRGTVHRVCQNRGCWMELTAEGVTPVFVPMAGHAFFLPRDAQGRPAEVEGTIELREMGSAEREHLESEGATATRAQVQLVASGVRLEGSLRRHDP